MLIDTHCHLTDERLANTDEVLGRAKKMGVDTVFILTTKADEWERALKIADGGKGVYVLLGAHPEEEGSFGLKKEFVVREAKRLMGEYPGKIIGIGEIGLDFHIDPKRETEKKQKDLFKVMLTSALELDLPVEIHSREAQEETKEVLLSLPKMPKGQFHCFGGDSQFLAWVLEHQFYVSFAGNVTFKKAEEVRSWVRKTPVERLLLETDSPYLAPEPLRGSVNEPGNVKIIAECIAEIKGVPLEKMVDITSKNTKCLYCLEG